MMVEDVDLSQSLRIENIVKKERNTTTNQSSFLQSSPWLKNFKHGVMADNSIAYSTLD